MASSATIRNGMPPRRPARTTQAPAPITRASGKKTVVATRFVHNDRLVDVLGQQAFTAIRTSPGARAYYDRHRARGVEHQAALRQVANRLVDIMHGCLKSRTRYDETAAWRNQLAEKVTA